MDSAAIPKGVIPPRRHLRMGSQTTTPSSRRRPEVGKYLGITPLTVSHSRGGIVILEARDEKAQSQ
jgi:hypothetical protein